MAFARALGVWVFLAVLAIANGIVRTTCIEPRVGEYGGHVIGSAVFVVVIFAVTFVFVGRLPAPSRKRLLGIGLFWLALTVAFEFLFGRGVAKEPWSVLLADYNIFRGRLWLVVLAATCLAPAICGRLVEWLDARRPD
ncbi:MAG: hypothetical protein JXR94_00785 [Candidatus Hydrogenedentes bacterium]|nr:hypothetical protein [Candidatus Hydrogenedentota bacterium]